jgi:isopropylmalate/homocitrate/citramalate synthase
VPLITDVSPRDGLQNDSVHLEPGVRTELCRRLLAAGIQRVEAVSFVSERHVPAMAGAEEVLDGLVAERDALVGLVLNRRGFDRAAETGLRRINLGAAVTESFSRRNQGVTRAQAEAMLAEVVPLAREAGMEVIVTLSVCFGCPFEGRVDPARVLALVELAAGLEVDAIVLADTIGVAVPAAVRELVSGAVASGVAIGGHFHDTRNTAIANCLTALEAGATRLDASAGGVGGCPFAPGATGNVATEDVVYALEESGVATGIELDALIDVARWLGGRLGHPIPSALARAGGFPEPDPVASASG